MGKALVEREANLRDDTGFRGGSPFRVTKECGATGENRRSEEGEEKGQNP